MRQRAVRIIKSKKKIRNKYKKKRLSQKLMENNNKFWRKKEI